MPKLLDSKTFIQFFELDKGSETDGLSAQASRILLKACLSGLKKIIRMHRIGTTVALQRLLHTLRQVHMVATGRSTSTRSALQSRKLMAFITICIISFLLRT